jgi:hypothetical protein
MNPERQETHLVEGEIVCAQNYMHLFAELSHSSSQ